MLAKPKQRHPIRGATPASVYEQYRGSSKLPNCPFSGRKFGFAEREAAMMGEGGSIPFMGMLGEKYPKAQFVITGVLGPHSNAHGPNEFLHITMVKGVTLAVSQVLVDHFARER